ncbi:hypothetical protein K431DRAFT_68644 [Polychaeton citri CBS 116435]|uniref:Zn(2)-C6 fungal-type domain-containing protein n=1 Tax=Polychaeton citri CBS 116435 TaxID=1314669 RepID=A0A9P4Q8S9_9PEZI|nr:hypothetical protein K431DRAFT_68644 [Polychaeton citri CBS 116435]
MPPHRTDSSKRTNKACERCKTRKVRCSGTHPCERCLTQQHTCVFSEVSNRVSVSERYLRELESRCGVANEEEATSPMRPGAINGSRTTHENPSASAAPEIRTPISEGHTGQDTPLVQTSSTIRLNAGSVGESREARPSDAESLTNHLLSRHPFMRDTRGKPWFLGPSSTWSFSHHVMLFLKQRIPEECATPPYPVNSDGTAWNLTWSHQSLEKPPDVSNLPPKDYTMHLYNTFQFHAGQVFRFVDEKSFLPKLHAFYKDPLAVASSSRLWYCQLLLVIVFGKSFAKQPNSYEVPDGWSFASRALSMIPESHDVSGERLLQIEVLCLAAMYLQAIDMRASAYIYVGKALRLCFVEGIHSYCPEEIHGRQLAERCSYLWWSVYSLDLEFAALMGAPSSVREEDITALPPTAFEDSCQNTAFMLRIKLSRLVARILTTVYSVGAAVEGSFFNQTQSVLHSLAELAPEIQQFSSASANKYLGALSKLSAHVTLSWHHCVVLASRPLVMSLLVKTFSQHNQLHVQQSRVLPIPVEALLQMCVDSACAVLKILHALRSHDLLDTTLPFQLEDTFASTFLLSIVQVIRPKNIADAQWHLAAHDILDAMITNRSSTARLRKAELEHLSQLLDSAKKTSEAAQSEPDRNRPNLTEGERDAGQHSFGGLPSVDASTALIHDWALDGATPDFGIGMDRDDVIRLADQLDLDDGLLESFLNA